MTEDEINDRMRATIRKSFEGHFGFTPSDRHVERLLDISTKWAHDEIRACMKAMREESASS